MAEPRSSEVLLLMARQEADNLLSMVEELRERIHEKDVDPETVLFLIDQATGNMSRTRSWLVNYQERNDDKEEAS